MTFGHSGSRVAETPEGRGGGAGPLRDKSLFLFFLFFFLKGKRLKAKALQTVRLDVSKEDACP